MDNTHEVAQRANPAARIVYVDNDPLVLVHANALLTNVSPEGSTWYVRADVRKPEQVLDEARALLDFDRPIAVLLLGVVGHATPAFEDMLAVVRTLVNAVPSGSYLAMLDGTDTSAAARESAALGNYALRSLDELRECVAGLEVLEPRASCPSRTGGRNRGVGSRGTWTRTWSWRASRKQGCMSVPRITAGIVDRPANQAHHDGIAEKGRWESWPPGHGPAGRTGQLS